MAIRVTYHPMQNIGDMAAAAGLGQYRQQQFENSMQSARFAADQMESARNFMAQQQQNAIQNAMRERQMAEGAMENRARFGLALSESRNRNAMGWYDKISDDAYRGASLEWQREKEGGRADLQRELFGNKADLQRELLGTKQEGYDRRNELLKQMQQERLQSAMSLQEKKQVQQWDMLEANLIAGARAGRYAPGAASQRLEMLRMQRAGLHEQVQSRMQAQEANEEVELEKSFQRARKTDEAGRVWKVNSKGEWDVAYDPVKESSTLIEHAVKALTETKTDLMGNKTTILPKPEQVRAHVEMIRQMQKELAQPKGEEKKPPPQAEPQQSPMMPGQADPYAKLRESPYGQSFIGAMPTNGVDREQLGGMEPGDVKPAAEAQLVQLRERFKAKPERLRDVDMVAEARRRFPSLADAPPEVQQAVLAAIQRIKSEE